MHRQGDQKKLSWFLGMFGIWVACLISFSAMAEQDLITLFPLNRYSQNVDTWIKPDQSQYDKPLLSPAAQKEKVEQFYKRFMGDLSPWSGHFIKKTIEMKAPDDVQSLQKASIENFSNRKKPSNKLGHGVHFRPYPLSWIQSIAHNMNLPQFAQMTYQPNRRGIAIDNLHARLLPTEDVHFYSHKLAGEGYPFDNLQHSSIWVGTPVYILGETRNHHWLLVLTPDFLAWVKANGIARVSETFVRQWQDAAKKRWMAITRTEIPLRDETGRYLYAGYMGAVFPAEGERVMLPVADIQGKAVIKYGKIAGDRAATIPLAATPRNFSRLISALIGRPYGWGNLYFYNDCSAELKSLFAPFGIWLPRWSSDQPKAGRVVDLSFATKEQRLAYLHKEGKPFMTIVYIGGHVFLYVGKHASLDPKKEGKWTAMTYQSVWGLKPKSSTKRAVIGRSVFLPLLLQYPEDKSLVSMADKGAFKVIYLD